MNGKGRVTLWQMNTMFYGLGLNFRPIEAETMEEKTPNAGFVASISSMYRFSLAALGTGLSCVKAAPEDKASRVMRRWMLRCIRVR